MYEILKQYENIGQREINVDELRNLLGIAPEEYFCRGWFNNFRVKNSRSVPKSLKRENRYLLRI